MKAGRRSRRLRIAALDPALGEGHPCPISMKHTPYLLHGQHYILEIAHAHTREPPFGYFFNNPPPQLRMSGGKKRRKVMFLIIPLFMSSAERR
ncbi:hypothetical protein TNIN_304961 [Trichonephila inaurata madagascariensis]|uniref:Uncharacterized protein n=1 Tax=Trichonephila inaurata madagascariensis TaxID=2747483 RepID=A0A8X6K2P8_9ARAC|nr:hypothetical protein TNIN_304961 [Trichonephila inaurata madagascariensis]